MPRDEDLRRHAPGWRRPVPGGPDADDDLDSTELEPAGPSADADCGGTDDAAAAADPRRLCRACLLERMVAAQRKLVANLERIAGHDAAIILSQQKLIRLLRRQRREMVAYLREAGVDVPPEWSRYTKGSE